MKYFTFEVPVYCQVDDEIKEYIRDNIEELQPAMDFSYLDDRATIDSVEVTDIQLLSNQVFITYEYEWSVYYGCDDMNGGDSDEDVIEGTRSGNILTFEIPEPVRRYPNDEL